MPFPNTIENEILNYFTAVSGSWTQPAAIYAGLSSTMPNKAGGGITEPTGVGSYARVLIAAGSTGWNTAASGATDNKQDIVFPTATADWGAALVAIVLWTTLTGTTRFLGWIPLSVSKSVLSGETAKILIGDEDLKFDQASP